MKRWQGRIQEFIQGGLTGWAQHPLGPENPLKSKGYTGPRGLAPLNSCLKDDNARFTTFS